jgi:hypothetical protein
LGAIQLFQARDVSRSYYLVTLLHRGQQPGLTPAALGIIEDRNSRLDCGFFLTVAGLELRFVPLTCK